MKWLCIVAIAVLSLTLCIVGHYRVEGTSADKFDWTKKSDADLSRIEELIKSGRTDEARNLAEKELLLCKSSFARAKWLWLRGTVDYECGRDKAALACFREATRLDSRQVQPFVSLCWLLKDDWSSRLGLQEIGRVCLEQWPGELEFHTITRAPHSAYVALAESAESELRLHADNAVAMEALILCDIRRAANPVHIEQLLAMVRKDPANIRLKQTVIHYIGRVAPREISYYPLYKATIERQLQDLFSRTWSRREKRRLLDMSRSIGAVDFTVRASNEYQKQYGPVAEMQLYDFSRSDEPTGIQKLCKEQPNDLSREMLLNQYFKWKLNYKEAMKHGLKAVQLADSNATVWVELADSQRTIGDYEGAEQSYRQVLKLDPTRVDAVFSLAMTQASGGYFDKAAASLDYARRKQPLDELLSLGSACRLSVIAHECGEKKLARQYFKEAIEHGRGCCSAVWLNTIGELFQSGVRDEKLWDERFHADNRTLKHVARSVQSSPELRELVELWRLGNLVHWGNWNSNIGYNHRSYKCFQEALQLQPANEWFRVRMQRQVLSMRSKVPGQRLVTAEIAKLRPTMERSFWRELSAVQASSRMYHDAQTSRDIFLESQAAEGPQELLVPTAAGRILTLMEQEKSPGFIGKTFARWLHGMKESEQFQVAAQSFIVTQPPQRCLETLSAAIEAEPNMPALYRLRAAVYSALSRKSQAAKDVDKALSLNPKLKRSTFESDAIQCSGACTDKEKHLLSNLKGELIK